MQAKEIMSCPIITTPGTVTLSIIKGLFSKNKISSAPVIGEDGEIEGIISTTDLSAIHNEDMLVRDVMSRHVKVCALTARVKDLGAIMTKDRIHHIVVMDNGQVQGMVSSLDVIKGLMVEGDEGYIL